jgi:hypothetical protein
MKNSMTIFRIIRLDFDYSNLALQLELGGVLLLVIIFIIGFLFISKQKNKTKFKLIEMGVEISGTPKVMFKVKRDYSNLYIANRIYIELITRKAALLFEEDKDVIIEIYASWYLLFGLIREEIKTIPGHDLQSTHSGSALVSLTTKILNDGLRPHLTTYQAAFRKWYEVEIKKTASAQLSPQQVQEQYPKYQDLVADIKKANLVLVDYTNNLKQFIEGNE